MRAFPQLYTKGESAMEPNLSNEDLLQPTEAYSR